MKKTSLLLVTVLSLLLQTAGLVNAQTLADYKKEVYTHKGDTLLYRILLPENFDPAKKYPLILMLHGAGERGNNNEAQLAHGGDLFLKPDVRQKFPAIVVFPQCPKNDFWAKVDIRKDTVAGASAFAFEADKEPGKAMHGVLGLLAQLLHEKYVNKKQVYLGGLSMGGMGTFELLWRKPKVFAAAFPICGGGNTAKAKKYAKKVPLWVFHGAKDNVVLPKYSEKMVQAIKDAGGEPKFTVYPNATHNSWDNAFAEPELLPWLFAHHQ